MSCTPCAQPADVNAHATCDGTTCGVACNAGFHPAGGSCIEDSCADGIRNQNESDVDCGGTCVAQGKTCATGAACVSASDCTTRYCPANACAACGAGTHVCSNTCVSDNSVSSCGTSCTPCSAPADPHAHATCNGTSCGSACDGGYILSGGVCVGNTNACCGGGCVDCVGDNGVGWSCVSGVCRCTSPTACRL